MTQKTPERAKIQSARRSLQSSDSGHTSAPVELYEASGPMEEEEKITWKDIVLWPVIWPVPALLIELVLFVTTRRVWIPQGIRHTVPAYAMMFVTGILLVGYYLPWGRWFQDGNMLAMHGKFSRSIRKMNHTEAGLAGTFLRYASLLALYIVVISFWRQYR